MNKSKIGAATMAKKGTNILDSAAGKDCRSKGRHEGDGFVLLGSIASPRLRLRGDNSLPNLSAHQSILNASVFLYPSVEAAQAGKGFGGSGVAIAHPLEGRPDLAAGYVVTNWHVACQKGHSVMRFTGGDGKTYIVDSDPAEWSFIPQGPDLAAIQMYGSPTDLPMFVGSSEFVTDTVLDVLVGEDVFVVPASDILKLLDLPEMKRGRQELARKAGSIPSPC